MSSGLKLYGLYNDDEILVNGAKSLVGKGIKVNDVYSPFPVHGIERIIGIKWTRLAICAFLYGITGSILAITGMWYFMIVDWPMDIGGKPNFSFLLNMPAFVPIMFEFTVLCAAHGMALTYFLRNWTLPGVSAKNPHPRTTDDHFAMEIVPEDNSNFSKEDLENMLKETGTVEVFEK
ncbi:MAG: DUF3341 domain-containing protein [Salibacteraceae bacterium]